MSHATNDGGVTPLLVQVGGLWRRKWTFLLVVVVATALAVAYSVHKTPIFQSTATLRLSPQLPSAVLNEENSSIDSVAATVDVPTSIQVLESATVADRVAKTLQSPPGLSASQVGTTDVVNLTVRSPRPLVAARAANAYARAYLSLERSSARAGVSAAVRQLQLQVTNDSTRTRALQKLLAKLPAGQQSTNLSAVISTSQQAEITDQSQLGEYQTALALTSGGGTLLSAATPSASAVVPKTAEYILAAIIVGVILGGALALLLDRLDDRIQSRDSAELVLGDTPLIGSVPKMRIRGGQPPGSLVTLRDPYSRGSESYRLIAAAIDHLRSSQDLAVVQVTSARRGEGTSLTAANLAVAAAQIGITTILVDCNLREPRLHALFALPRHAGFTSAVSEPNLSADVLNGIEGAPNLRVLTAGPSTSRPSDVLGSAGAREVMLTLRGLAELVILDSCPVLFGADAAVTARLGDATLMVVAAKGTTRTDLRSAINGLDQVGARPSAAILNFSAGRDSDVRASTAPPDPSSVVGDGSAGSPQMSSQ